VTLKEELQIAMLNLELEHLRFQKSFKYSVKIADNVDAEQHYVPSLILNPIIENAIWHGLLPLGEMRDATLVIEARREENSITLIVEDNGVGRKAARSTEGNIRESKGLKITEQRLSNINYLYNINSSVMTCIDLVDEGGAAGTRVVISLPDHLKPLSN
jgi:LytS/YehU family sensor histidine kinase